MCGMDGVTSGKGHNFDLSSQENIKYAAGEVGKKLNSAENAVMQEYAKEKSDPAALFQAQADYDKAKQVMDMFVAMVSKINQTMQNMIQQFAR